MFKKIDVPTDQRQQLCLITDAVQNAVKESGIQEGICILYCPHTTAGLTVNSYMDPATAADLVLEIDRLVPTRTDFQHIFDTPSDAAGHIKSTLVGNQITLIVDQAKAILGSSQGIFLCEFDGPRQRQVYCKIIQG